MSTKIDERVVEMRFDNKHFESNVQTSLSTLDRLKKALNFKDSSKSLDSVSAAAKNVNFNGLTGAVETVHAKFSAFEVVAVTALANITNSAINAGKQIVESLTIEPIHQGFEEYELKMGSVQTIMASTGATLEEVNGYLDELNTYADRTIYSFSDMTNNIGKFTNAGVDLKDAVKAIQGISNEAAVSGANANEASRAMYNFAQALSAGAVKLIDWKSIENANMATVEFKQNLINTAVELGTLTESEGKYTSTTTDLSGKTSEAFTATRLFNESLSSQWMTTDVLVQTLGRYSDETTEIGKKAFAAAQDVKTLTQLMDTLKEAAGSGWAQTWELLIGDFNQAKESFTWLSEKIGGIINDSAEARNELLSGALSSKKVSLADWDSLNESGLATNKDFILAVKDAAREHGVAIDQMIEDEGTFRATMKRGWLSHDILTEAFENMSKGVEKTEEYTVQAGDTLSGLAEKYGTTVEELVELNGIEDANMIFTGQILKLSTALTETTELTEEQKAAYEELNASLGKVSGRELLWESLKNSIEAVLKVSSTLKAAWDEVFSPMTSEGLYEIIESIHEFSQKLIISDETAEKLKRTMKGVFSVFKIVADIATGALSAGLDVVSGIFRIFGSDILDTTASMGDMLVGVKDWIASNEIISNVFSGISKILLDGISALHDWIMSVYASEGVQSFIAKLGSVFSDTFGKIGEALKNSDTFFTSIPTGIKSAVSKIKEWFNTFKEIPVVKANIERFGDAFSKTFENLKNFCSNAKVWVKEFIDQLKSSDHITLEGIQQAFSNLKEKIGSYFKNIGNPFENLRNAISGFKDDVKKQFDEMFGGFADFKGNIFEFFKGIIGAITGIDVSNILKVGFFGSLITCIFSLRKVFSGFGSMTKSIGTFIASLRDISRGFNKYMKAKAFAEKTDSIANLVKSLTMFVGVIGLLTLCDIDKLWDVFKVVAALIGTITLASILIGKFGGGLDDAFKGLNKLSLTMLAISASVMIFVLAVEKMMGLIDGDNFVASLAVIALIAAGLAGLTIALAKWAPEMSKGSKFLLSFSVSLYIIAAAIGKLAKVLGDADNLGEVAIAFVGIIAGLAVVAKMANGMQRGSGAGILAISVSLLLMVRAIKKIAKIKGSDLIKGGIVLAALGVMLGILISVSKDVSGSAKTIIALGLSVYAMAQSIALLSGIDFGSLMSAVVALGALMGVFTLVMKASGRAGGSAKSILGLAIVIGVLAASLYALSSVDLESLIGAVAALSIVMGVFTLVMKVSGRAGGSAKSILGLSIVIGVLATSLYGLSGIDLESLLGAAAALSIVMGMTSLLAAVSKLAKGAQGSIVALSLIVVGIGVTLYLLSDLPVENTLRIAEALSLVILALSGACVLLGVTGKLGNAATAGALELVKVVGIVGIFMAAIGALVTYVPEAEEFLKNGIPVLSAVGEGIGTFIGSIIGGFASGVTSGLPDIGSNLGDFMENAQPFFEGVKGITSDSTSGVSALAGAILELTGAELLDAIASFITGSDGLGDFGAKLASFGTALVQYADSVSTLKEDAIAKINTSAEAGKVLIGMAKELPNSGGILQKFLGEKDLGDFGIKLSAFGTALCLYGMSVSTLNEDTIAKINTSVEAGKVLIGMAKELPNSGGILQKFLGEKDLGGFGIKLSAFGTALCLYGMSVSTLNEDTIAKISTSAEAGKALIGMAKELPNSGGILEDFFGGKDLGDFGENLKSFGTSLANYSDAVKDIPSDIATKTQNMTTALTALSESAKIDNGVENNDRGLSYLEDFGVKIQNFSGNIADFISIDYTTLDSVKASIEKVIEMIKSTEGLNLDAFKNMGSALSDFGDLDIDNFTEAIEDSAGSISGAANAIIDALAEGVTTGEENSLTTVFNSLITDILAEFVTKNLTFKVAGQALADNLISGIGSKALNITTTVLELLGGAVSTINGYYTNFYDAGAYVVDGFANGISDNTWKAEAKAKAMAKAAKEGAEKELNEHSPSKVFYGIGDFAGQGFVNGLSAYESKSYNAGRDMAAASKAGLGDAISKITDVIDGNIDTTPTIRPVLDLSEIKSGAGTLNTLLTGHRSVGVMANVSAISYGMRGRSNSTDDVVAAIRGLGKDIGNMSSGDTFVVDGVTYDDGSNIASAVQSLVRAAKMERRV